MGFFFHPSHKFLNFFVGQQFFNGIKRAPELVFCKKRMNLGMTNLVDWNRDFATLTPWNNVVFGLEGKVVKLDHTMDTVLP